MSDDDLSGWALPAFRPDDGLQRLKRDLRELGLSERAGQFERRGQALARARVDGDSVLAARVKRPARHSPEWVERRLRTSADMRDFVQDLRRCLAQWSDDD
jgi:hypothetical protein